MIPTNNNNYNNNNIPEIFSPIGGTSDMEHIHSAIHTPEATTKIKTNSVQKDTSDNTEIQLTPVDKFGQDQTSLAPSVTSILTVLHF